MAESAQRLVLDQNFPQPLLRDMGEWIPAEIAITHLGDLDDRLRSVGDRELFIALRQRGFDGLITNNYKMLHIPREVAAIVATRATVLAVKGGGHDPIRAAGAVLLELPGLVRRLRPNQSKVFLLNYQPRRREDGWHFLKVIADRGKVEVKELHAQVRVSAEELERPVP